MGKFDKLYKQLISNQNKKLYRDFQKWKLALENANIIKEEKELLIDVPNQFIEFCLSHQNQIIKLSQINTIFKKSKHYSNISNDLTGKNFYFSIFDFSNNIQVNKFLDNVIKFKDLSEREEYKNIFIQNYSNSNGIEFQYVNTYFCCINKKYTGNWNNILYHQLSHFMQDFCHIRKTPGTEHFNKQNNSILNVIQKYLRVDLNTILYYFNKKEFSVYVDQMCRSLYDLYLKYYSNITTYTFLNKEVFDIIRDTPLDKIQYTNLVMNFNSLNNGNVQPLIMLIIAYHLNYNYIKICKQIQHYFSNKEKD